MTKIDKPELDEREYEVFTLKNEMEVMLISDPKTEKASAACDVNVGYFFDPDYLPGIAHFLEHMLFLGTEKYPKEGEYQNVVKKYGGKTNAYTDMEHTNYYFDVNSNHLDEVLDRFSHFFISPLFTEDASDRELNAVHNEHMKNIQADVWRELQFLRSKSNPLHPFSKFGTGNLETLKETPSKKGINVREELKKFHAKYYSSNIMKLVVYGKESLEDLKKMVVEKFEAVENKQLKPEKFLDIPVIKETQNYYKITPIKDIRTLTLIFPVDSKKGSYLTKVDRYYSHLIGHEGSGSLFAFLKKKGWLLGLASGCSSQFSEKCFFKIIMEMTEEGQNYQHEIIEYTFQYIELLKKTRVKKRIFDESKSLAEVSFRFKDKSEPFDYSSNLAKSLHLYPKEHVLSGHYLLYEYDGDKIENFLKYLSIDNMNILSVTKKNEKECNQTERWYQTKYFETKISNELIEKCSNPVINENLFICPPNEFIPKNLKLAEIENKEPNSHPFVIKESKFQKVWFKQDVIFKRPKAIFFFNFIIPTTYSTPQNILYARIYCDLVVDSLNEYSYDASVAGLHYNVTAGSDGFQIIVAGYNDKISILTKNVFEKISSLKIDENRFFVFKKRLLQRYMNYHKEQPYQHAISKTIHCLYQKRYEYTDYIEVMDDLNVDYLEKTFIPYWLSSFYIESLLHGNLTKNDALEIIKDVESDIFKKVSPILKCQFPDERIIELPTGKDVLIQMKEINEENPNSSIEMVYQIGHNFDELNALLSIFCQIVESPFNEILRTKEQLGYLVFSRSRHDHNVISFSIIIQSSDKDPIYIQKKCEDFLDSFVNEIKEMKKEDFEHHVKACIDQNKEKDHQLGDESSRHWNEIHYRQYKFSRRESNIVALEKVQQNDIVEFFEKYISNTSTSKKRLIVQVFASQHYDKIKNENEKNVIYVTDVDEFKNSFPTFASKL
eukprot:gene884-9795_t